MVVIATTISLTECWTSGLLTPHFPPCPGILGLSSARCFLQPLLSCIYNNYNYLQNVSFPLKSSRKTILLESPHQIQPIFCFCHFLFTVKSKTYHCQDKAGVWSICFLLRVLITSQFGILCDNEKREGWIYCSIPPQISWLLDFQANLKETSINSC